MRAKTTADRRSPQADLLQAWAPRAAMSHVEHRMSNTLHGKTVLTGEDKASAFWPGLTSKEVPDLDKSLDLPGLHFFMLSAFSQLGNLTVRGQMMPPSSLGIFPNTVFLSFFLSFFFKIFGWVWTIFSLYWTCYNIVSIFCFGLLTTRHVGSQLPDQGSNPHPLCWKVKF